MMKRKSRGQNINKGLCCAMFGWTRYKFDQNIAKGMPYVRAAAHKGEEWTVNTAEVEAWVEEGVIDYLGETADVRPFLADADCVVLPSYREGLPRTLLEAAATARPVIATDVPGCRQAVEDGRTGFLCAARDAGSLAEAMLRMLRLPAERRLEMGRAGRARVEAEYDERLVIARYLEAIARTSEPT
jgi:glycosyltransferase involved in cell wall biosynthesis